MIAERLPPGLLPAGATPNFTEETVPESLTREHRLAPGRWGVLHIFEGSIAFEDLSTGVVCYISAPDLKIIGPEVPHKVSLDSNATIRIDFFRMVSEGEELRTPGMFANEPVAESLARCEARGDFGELFYRNFLSASPEIAPYFAGADFQRQRRLLHESVRMMVSRDVADPALGDRLRVLGQAHSRQGRAVLPKHYELWLDCVCHTVRQLDPDWTDDLERQWRVRLRPGMQIIMAAF